MSKSESLSPKEGKEQLSSWLVEVDSHLMGAILALTNHPNTVKNPRDIREGTVSDIFLRILEERGELFFQAGKELETPPKGVLLKTDRRSLSRVREINNDERLRGFCSGFENSIGPMKSHWWLLDVWHQQIGEGMALGLSYFLYKREERVRQLIVFIGVKEAVSGNIKVILDEELKKRTQDLQITCPPKGNPLPAIYIPKLTYLLGAINKCNSESKKCMGALKGGKFDDGDWRAVNAAIFCRKVKGFHRFGEEMEGVWQALDKGNFDLAKEELAEVMEEFPYAFKREDCLWLTGTRRRLIADEVEERRAAEKAERAQEAGRRQRRSLGEIQEKHDGLRNRVRRTEELLYGLGIFREQAVEELGELGKGTVRLIESVTLEKDGRYFMGGYYLREFGSTDRLSGKFRERLIIFAQLWLVNEKNQVRLRKKLEAKGRPEEEIREIIKFIKEAQKKVDRLSYLERLMRKRRRK